MQQCKMTIEKLDKVGKELICFGSKKAFDKFFEIFEDRELIPRIKYIVENDSSKWGKRKSYGGREIPIVAPEDFMKDSHNPHTVCIIALKDKDAIFRQYESISRCDSMIAIWHQDIMREYCTRIFDEARPVENLRRINKMMIPKVIHYCWFGRGKIPAENLAWMASWKKHCPDYEIVQWNEDNYDITQNKYMKQAYEHRHFAYATDYARLDILFEHGGIYLDTDVELIKNLDELLFQPAFFGWEDGLRVATGLGFGVKKQFPLLKEMRDYYNEIDFIQSDGSFDLTACPTFQTRILQRYGLKKDGNYQIIRDAAILPVTYLCGQESYVLHTTRSKYTFAVHHFQGSGRASSKG